MTVQQRKYCKSFRRTVEQVFLAANILHTKLVTFNDTSRLSTLASSLSTCAGAVPMGLGISLSVLGYYLQTVSEDIARRRLDKILSSVN